MVIEASKPFVPTALVLQADNAFAAARGGRQQLQRLRADLLGDADTASWYARQSGRSALALPRSPRAGAQVGGQWVDPNDEPELVRQLETIVRKLDALDQDRHGIPYDFCVGAFFCFSLRHIAAWVHSHISSSLCTGWPFFTSVDWLRAGRVRLGVHEILPRQDWRRPRHPLLWMSTGAHFFLFRQRLPISSLRGQENADRRLTQWRKSLVLR